MKIGTSGASFLRVVRDHTSKYERSTLKQESCECSADVARVLRERAIDQINESIWVKLCQPGAGNH